MPSNRKMKKTPRATSTARDSDGMIEWVALTDAERQAFAKAFLAPDAVAARIDATVPRGSHSDFWLKFLLRLFEGQKQMREDVTKGKLSHHLDDPRVAELLSKIIASLLHLEDQITHRIWFCMRSGLWDGIIEFATYCKARCPEGLAHMVARPEVSVFPVPIKEQSDVMLWTFVRLTQCDPLLLIHAGDGADDPAFDATKPVRQALGEWLKAGAALKPRTVNADLLPKRLPTKAHLAKAFLNDWEAVSGVKTVQDTRISELRGALGLGGLPKKRKRVRGK